MNRNPFQQGNLDGLCGIYSIVNASLMVNKQNTINAKSQFEQLINLLHEKNLLIQAMTEGLFYKNMKEILEDRDVKKLLPKTSIPFNGVKTPRLQEFWATTSEFINDTDNSRGVVIIGIAGFHDHWTVVSEINANAMTLQDSSGLKRLNRRNCTTHHGTSSRRHILKPAQSFFLRGPDQ